MELSEKYLQNVFAYLAAIKAGNVFDVHSIDAQVKREKFTEAVKQYIDNGNTDFEFSNDYRYVIRMEVPEAFK